MVAFVASGFALVAVVVGLLLRPVWKDERTLGLFCGAAFVLAAGTIYAIVGTPDAVFPENRVAPRTLDEAVSRMERKVAGTPDRVEAWSLLGALYAKQGRTIEARDAYAKAMALAPLDANVLVEAARSRAFASPLKRFDDSDVAILRSALEREPNHQRARWFLGVAYRQAGRPDLAAEEWSKILPSVTGAARAPLIAQIAAARDDAGLPPVAGQGQARASHAVRVFVDLPADHPARTRIVGKAMVYVMARKPGGTGMPIAVERHAATRLPITTTLDDSDSVMPTAPFSMHGDVELVARMSFDGDPKAAGGGIESRPVRLHLPNAELTVLRLTNELRAVE